MAEKYQVSESTVNRWIAQGMPKYKIGKNVRFDELEVDEWFRERGKKQK